MGRINFNTSLVNHGENSIDELVAGLEVHHWVIDPAVNEAPRSACQ